VSTALIVYVLTALAALVIVLTRVRLAGENEGAGQFSISRGVVLTHFVAGVVAEIVWVTFLIAPEDSTAGGSLVGIIALAFWWIVSLCGLLILTRWLPSHGRHAGREVGDTWSEGPGLSLLAHLGMAIAVVLFTMAYLTSKV
jgi:hypothetical protein